LTVHQYYPGGCLAAVGFICGKRSRDRTGPRQMPREHPGINDALGRTVGADRIHRVSSIAQQRSLAECPLRQWIAVDHRKFVDRSSRFNNGRYIHSVPTPVRKARQEIGSIAQLVPVTWRRAVDLGHLEVADPVKPGRTSDRIRPNRVSNELLRGGSPTAHREAETAKAHRG